MLENEIELCRNCPRNCCVDRKTKLGYCQSGYKLKIARAMLHQWEEPCISGTNGSGAIFFSGCPLRCVFCQNSIISKESFGAEISVERLVEIFFELQEQGAHNINLVSPTQYISQIRQALLLAKPTLKIPIVYNTSGYEKVSALKTLDGLIDIYLPDFKYKDEKLAKDFSAAQDYFEVTSLAIEEMFRQVGKFELDENGIMKKGVIVRHLILPGYRQNSKDVMTYLGEKFACDEILISLMSQYTPEFYNGTDKNLKRKITTFEYNQVLDTMLAQGFDGYTQEKNSASTDFTPSFKLEGVLKNKNNV